MNDLFYFQPAGTVLKKDDFYSRLLPSPIMVRIELTMTPQFHSDKPTALIQTDVSVSALLRVTLENGDNTFAAPVGDIDVVLFNEAGESQREFSTSETDASQEVANPAIFPLTGIIATKSLLENATDSFGFRALAEFKEYVTTPKTKTAEATEGYVGVRKPKWFKEMGALFTDYARNTHFLLQAETVPVVQQPNPLAIPDGMPTTDGQIMGSSVVPPVPTISPAQINEMRADRDEVMKLLTDAIAGSRTLSLEMSLDALRANAYLSSVVNGVVSNGIDAAVAATIKGLTDSMLTPIG